MSGEYTFTPEAQKECAIMALAAVITFIILLTMGDLQGPAEMPVPPSQTNYSSSN